MEDSGLPNFIAVIASAAVLVGIIVAVAAVTWVLMLTPL